MKIPVMFGAALITLAVIIYTISIILEIKQPRITKKILRLFTIAVVLDLSATICMFIAAGRFIFNLHGMLGYTALFLMLIKLIFILNYHKKYGSDKELAKNERIVSVVFYLYWLSAYINGILTAMPKH